MSGKCRARPNCGRETGSFGIAGSRGSRKQLDERLVRVTQVLRRLPAVTSGHFATRPCASVKSY